ncbi:MAG: hypothetical protein ACRDNF_12595 [Streptosporangiaceae bacterium]
MALRFIGIDPETDVQHCPAVFVDEDTGDLVFTGSTVTNPDTLAEVTRHSPIATHESVVRMPARMSKIILEAVRDSEGSAVQ